MAAANTPEWWADRLTTKLARRRAKLQRLEDYYAGRTPLAYATSRYRREFGTMLSAISDNWTQLVVSAVEERLNVEGFRIGNTDVADARAWELWQRNNMDEDSQIAHTEALKLCEAHAIVWKSDTDQDPVTTIEHPFNVCVELDPENRSKRLAGVKAWRDEVHGHCATVYLPDAIYKLRRGKKGWEPRPTSGELWPIPNPWGVVPVVPILNRPGLLEESASEIEPMLPKQDMINKLLADMMISAEFAGFRQRWATGVDIPEDNEMMSAIDRLWHTEAHDAKFGEFDQTDLAIYIKAVEMLVQHIASQTATPPHYLLTTGVLPSGESLRAAEAPLVAKARRKQRVFGSGWEEVARLMLIMDGRGDEIAGQQISCIWSDPESRTESEHVDAIVKLQALGIPNPILWERVGFSQQEIARLKQEQLEQTFMVPALPPAPAQLPPAPSPMPTEAA